MNGPVLYQLEELKKAIGRLEIELQTKQLVPDAAVMLADMIRKASIHLNNTATGLSQQ